MIINNRYSTNTFSGFEIFIPYILTASWWHRHQLEIQVDYERYENYEFKTLAFCFKRCFNDHPSNKRIFVRINFFSANSIDYEVIFGTIIFYSRKSRPEILNNLSENFIWKLTYRQELRRRYFTKPFTFGSLILLTQGTSSKVLL